VSQKYLQKKANGSIVVTKDRTEEGRRQDKTHWVKQRTFQLMNYPALGLSNVLCIPAQGTGASTGSSKEGEEDATNHVSPYPKTNPFQTY